MFKVGDKIFFKGSKSFYEVIDVLEGPMLYNLKTNLVTFARYDSEEKDSFRTFPWLIGEDTIIRFSTKQEKETIEILYK